MNVARLPNRSDEGWVVWVADCPCGAADVTWRSRALQSPDRSWQTHVEYDIDCHGCEQGQLQAA